MYANSIGNEDIFLLERNLKTDKIKLILTDITRIPNNSENIVTAEFVEPAGHCACLVEPKPK